MQETLVKQLVESAICSLVREQRDLIDLDVTERAISHYLALYIMKVFPRSYNVDVEYNRDGYDPKRLNIEPMNLLSDEARAVTVYPDVIVHKRGRSDHNLLVLEMKKPHGSLEYDERKLRAFRSELGYKYAAHVIVGCNKDEVPHNLIWIEDDSSTEPCRNTQTVNL
jgi:hypothetical protein